MDKRFGFCLLDHLIYHCRLALALERITVAIRFIVRTKTNRTSAVPYWIWMGISGTWVEMTKR